MKDVVLPVEPRDLSAGDVLGRYELLLPVARGGMGQIWAARMHGPRGFQKIVAVKTILRSYEDDGRLESMLFDEASLASQVRHPNVVQTLDLGERDDGTMYLALEWVPGESLDYIMRAAGERGIPRPIILNFAMQALKGLRAVHEARSPSGDSLGIVHRDISLQNLLVTYGGLVKIIDFGIAKATQRMSAPTADGTVKGKFAYMAPEQLRGEVLDGRADLFGLGIVLYRVTTGIHPFKSDNPAATIQRILHEEPVHPCDAVPGYPRALGDAILKAMAKDRTQRFASAHDMLTALEQSLVDGERCASDKECEVFLRRLLDRRIMERGRTLRAALKAADEGGSVTAAEGPVAHRSHSTLRAVSLEAGADAARDSAAEAEKTPAESAPRTSPDARPREAHRGRSRRLTLAALATAMAVVVGVGLHRAGQNGGRALETTTAAVAGVPRPDEAPLTGAPASGSPAAPVSADDAPAVVQQPVLVLDAPSAPSVASAAPLRKAPKAKPDRSAPAQDQAPLAAPSASTPPAAAPSPALAPAVPTATAIPAADPLSRRK